MLSRCRPIYRSLGNLKRYLWNLNAYVRIVRMQPFPAYQEHAYKGLLIAYRYVSNDKLSKVEQTLKMLQDDVKGQYEEEKRQKELVGIRMICEIPYFRIRRTLRRKNHPFLLESKTS